MKKKMIINLIFAAIALGAAAYNSDFMTGDKVQNNTVQSNNQNVINENTEAGDTSVSLNVQNDTLSCDNAMIVDAYDNRISDLQVMGCGTVAKVLPDDVDGSKHQKLIVKLSGLNENFTILIAHNIDLAPRAQGATQGKSIKFYGEYEYTEQGGVVHWTHHDPAGRHTDGWLEVAGKRFE